MLPTVTQQASCDLPAGSNNRIGFSRRDEFLLAKKSSGTIGKYTCSTDSLLTTVWVKPLPQGVPYDCWKFITGTGGDIVLHEYITSTHIYTTDLALKSQEAADGLVLLAVTNDTLLYSDMPDGQYVVDIYTMSPYEKTVSLRPPAATRWNNGLSACVVPGSGDVMVAEYSYKQLSMFSAAGTIIIYTQ